jgi:hypothetical protein
MDLIALLQGVPGVGPYLAYVPVVIAIGAAIGVVLPAPGPTAGVAYRALYWVVQWCALNKGHAVNLSAPSSAGIVGGPGAISAPQMSLSAVPKAQAAALLVAASALLSLMACSSGAGSNPAADVAALESGLTAAESIATAYIRLPHCTGANGPLCSDSTIVGQIKVADAKAYTLVKAAEQAAGDPTALSIAEAAVTALTTITGTLPKQGA